MSNTIHAKALTAALLISAGLHGAILWNMNAMGSAALQQPSYAAGHDMSFATASQAAQATTQARLATLGPVLIQVSRRAYLAEQSTARALAAAKAARSAQAECDGKWATVTATTWATSQAGANYC